jgi:hypothetical protein
VGEPKATIQIDVAALAGLSRPLFGTPDHPLNFVVSRNGDARSAANIFEKRLDEIAKGRNFETMLAFVRAEANLRNRLLYASDEGIPSVEFADAMLLDRLGRVYALNILTIMILQTSQHQLFAVQCLHAFLIALGRLEKSDFDFTKTSTDAVAEGRPQVAINVTSADQE